jgi:hypothetical protein
MDPARLVGTWRLDRFEISFSDGRPPLHPFGEDAEGMLMYGRDGHMSAVLSRAGRAPLGASRLETSGAAPMQAKSAAFDSYLSYAGTWRMEGASVVHAVHLAQTPELVGIENRRKATLEGDTLTLSYDIRARSQVVRHYTLVWSRAHA